MALCLVVLLLTYFDVSHQLTTSPVLLVRLAGDNRLPNAGRLEILYNNTWGTVCSYDFYSRVAQVACYMLGFGRAGQYLGSYYGAGSGPIWLHDVQCNGNELSLAECRHDGWGVHDCHRSWDMSIICDNNCSATYPECAAAWDINVESLYERTVKGILNRDELVSKCSTWSNSNCSMPVQLDGCTLYFLSAQASQLLYAHSTRDEIHHLYNQMVNSMHHLCTNVEPDYELYQSCYREKLFSVLHRRCSYWYSSSSSCIWQQARTYCYARVIQETCNTSAADINMLKVIVYYLKVSEMLCKLSVDQLIGNATQLNEIADKVPTLAVRLAGDNRPPNAGRLEIYYNNTWGTVCDYWFGNEEAQVVCYMLGFGRSGLHLDNYYHSGSGPIWLSLMECNGNELSLAECGRHRDWGERPSYCSHAKDVSIICANNNCSAKHPGCETLWNTNTTHLTSDAVGTDEMQSLCRAWSDCSLYLEESGCSFSDIFVEVRQYITWFPTTENSMAFRIYNKTVDSLRSVCNVTTMTLHNDITTSITSTGAKGLWHETTLPSAGYTAMTTPETTMPLLRAISISSVWPLYGPEAGGTRVTITGQFLSVSTVTSVYFGQHQGLIDRENAVENKVVAITPPAVNATARDQAIELVLNHGFRINTNHTFEYRGNPVFKDIRPRDHLTRGGTEVTVIGDNLNSVAEPRLTITVIITRFLNDTDSASSKNETDSEPCNLPGTEADGRELLCKFPAVSLPDDFDESLAMKQINSTDGPGVAVYFSSDKRARAYVYIGLKLDGFKRYRNISSVQPHIKIHFVPPPIIDCEFQHISFDPSKEKVINIKGRHLHRGSRLVDFDIRLGDAVCVPVSLTNDQVDCRPPTNKPNKDLYDTFCRDDTLSLQLMIGYAHYQCSCVRYVSQQNTALIIGLSVGLGLLFIIITVIIVTVLIVHCRRRSSELQLGAQKVTQETPKDLGTKESQCHRRLPDDKKESIEITDFANGYSGQLPHEHNESIDSNENRYSRQLPDNCEESVDCTV